MVETKVGQAQPFLKWAGGKRQLLSKFEPLFPSSFDGYYEPFLGGGAVFFHLLNRIDRDSSIILGDVNQDLMITYQMIRDYPDQVIIGLQELQAGHGVEQYNQWRTHQPENVIGRALRFLYLNRACFNGLWRENKKGEMNTPIGDTPADRLFDFDNIRLVSKALQGVVLKPGPYYSGGEQIPLTSPRGWFIYLDPPYHQTFSSYSKNGFDEDAHRQLAKCAQYWSDHGAKVMLSNSDTEFVRSLFDGSDWNITVVEARRAISGKKSGRGKVGELVIRNYE